MSTNVLCTKKSHKVLLVACLSLFTNSIYAADVEIQPRVKSTTYVYQTKVNSGEYDRNLALVLEPSLIANYSSKRLSASVGANHTRVEQKDTVEGANKGFTDLTYKSQATLVENMLSLAVNGSQNYKAINQGQSFVSDKVLGAGDLTKYASHAALLTFVTPNPEYLGISAQTSYSKTSTDASTNNSSGINGDNMAASMQLYQGRHAENYSFNILAQYNETGRTSFQDFKSTIVNGTLGVGLSNTTSLILVGRSNEYDVDLEVGVASRTSLDSTSYGAGVEWAPTDERSIEVTYNQLEENDRTTNFVGLNINWALSQRTGFKFDYSKKFYGESYDFNFNYKLKNVASSIVYSEEVSSFSRQSLISSSGVFVCELGALDLVDCFQPESINYTLQAGEEFIDLNFFETDINEQVTFRKSGKFNIGYDKRRIKLTASVSYTNIEYLESNVERKTNSGSLSLNYKLGRSTNASMSTNISKTTRSESTSYDLIKTINLGISRSINNNLNLNLSARLLDRESETQGRNITDQRVTLALTYTF